MPKIRIKERDLTTNPTAGYTDNYILYVLSTEQQTMLTAAQKEQNAAVYDLYNNHIKKAPYEINLEEAKLLESYFKTKSAEGLIEEEQEEGQNKLIPENTFLTSAINLGGRIIIAYTWDQAEAYCGDRNQYDIKFILASEYKTKIESEKDELEEAEEPKEPEEANASDLDRALKIAEKRKDCVVLLETLGSSLLEYDFNLCNATCSYITADTDGDTITGFYGDEVSKFAGKYVAAFYSKSDIHDTVKVERTLRANEAYVLAYLNSIGSGNAEWLAVAGVTRGTIPGSYEVDEFLKEDEIDNMQSRTYQGSMNDVSVNPICNINPWGLRIWGNRTCLPNKNVADENGEIRKDYDQLVASSFLNVRVLICDLKKALYRASRQYQFEQDTDVLWVNFTSSVNTLLEEMKQSYGISAYRWIRKETTERAKLTGVLQIQVLEAVEDFDLTVELRDSLEVAE